MKSNNIKKSSNVNRLFAPKNEDSIHITPSLKIVSGQYKGRKLTYTSKSSIRPTLTRHRIRIFDWLREFVRNARVLDLFSGTGSLGFEALSRGAQFAHFVEVQASQAACLKLFAQTVGAPCEIFQMDARKYLNLSGLPVFDLIFLDPPFVHRNLYSYIIEKLLQSHCLAPQALIYCESSKNDALHFQATNLELFKEKAISGVTLQIYRYRNEAL